MAFSHHRSVLTIMKKRFHSLLIGPVLMVAIPRLAHAEDAEIRYGYWNGTTNVLSAPQTPLQAKIVFGGPYTQGNSQVTLYIRNPNTYAITPPLLYFGSPEILLTENYLIGAYDSSLPWPLAQHSSSTCSSMLV